MGGASDHTKRDDKPGRDKDERVEHIKEKIGEIEESIEQIKDDVEQIQQDRPTDWEGPRNVPSDYERSS